MSDPIAAGARVRLAYRLTDADGRLLEERTPETALAYVQGKAEILPALERALEGQTAGARVRLRLPPEDAYGLYDPALAIETDRGRFPADVEVRPGAKFHTQGPDGQPVVVRVTEVDDDAVSLDGNHPLAGLELIFEVTVLDVAGIETGDPGGALH